MTRSALLLPGFLAAMLLLANGRAAAEGPAGPCDDRLITLPDNPLGYRLRGDRCEGLYVEKVSGNAILIASWTASFDDFDSVRSPTLSVAWDAPDGAGPVRLRAQGLRRRLYYRMDALRPAGITAFTWPADLLAGLHIPRRDLGVTALTQVSVRGVQREVYLPLRIGQGATPAGGADYRLGVLPGVELGEVYLTLVIAGDQSATVLKDGEPLGYGYYPANRPFDIAIGGLSAKGFYQVKIAATLKSGGAATAEAWFYHPGS